jgi:hypothetical protein
VATWLLFAAGFLAGGLLLCRPERFGRPGANLLGWFCMALAMTSPLALHPERLWLDAGGGFDAFIGIWNLWWSHGALLDGRNPLETDLLFYPNGTSLVLHTFSLSYGCITLPVTMVISKLLSGSISAGTSLPALIVTYNLLIIASFAFTGYFTYRLSLLLTGFHRGALLSAFVFTFLTFRFANTVRLHVMGTEFLVLAVWTWAVFFLRPSVRTMFGWIVAQIALLFCSLEYTAYSVLLLPLTTLAVWPRRGWDLRALRHLSWRAPVVLVVVLGCLVPWFFQLRDRLTEGSVGFNPELTRFFSADLLDLFLPNPNHPLWGSWSRGITAGWHQGDSGFGMSVGWVALGLFLYASYWIVRTRTGRLWSLGALVFLVMTLGPVLHVGGTIYDAVTLPHGWLTKLLPLLATSRTPIRWMAPAGLFLSVAIAYGWSAHLLKRHPMPGRNLGVLEIVLIGLIGFESLALPLTLSVLPVPPQYAPIHDTCRQLDPALVVHIPGLSAREELLWQTIHGQPIGADIKTAMPMHSRQDGGPLNDSRWHFLSRDLGIPGRLDGINEKEQQSVIAALTDYIYSSRIRFIVLHQYRLRSNPDSSAPQPVPIIDQTVYDTFRRSLRLIAPLRELTYPGASVYEFAVKPLPRETES